MKTNIRVNHSPEARVETAYHCPNNRFLFAALLQKSKAEAKVKVKGNSIAHVEKWLGAYFSLYGPVYCVGKPEKILNYHLHFEYISVLMEQRDILLDMGCQKRTFHQDAR